VTPFFRVPSTLVNLWEHLLDGYDPSVDGPKSWDRSRYAQARGADLFLCDFAQLSDLVDPDPPTLYHGEPIELISFGSPGDAGLQYAWVVLAPELDLDDYPCVSYQPEDNLVWLGDDTRQALEYLLVGTLKEHHERGGRLGRRAAKRGAAVPADKSEPSPADDPRWAALCQVMQLRPDTVSPGRTWTARRDRSIEPPVPPGWRYESASEGIGVLAEAGAFVPEPFEIDPDWYGDVSVEHAQRILDRGFPATALCILKETDCGEPGVVETMRTAYHALGRTLHVDRADAWLQEWAEPTG
jgi:hypothetical protein